jgi:2-(1,2-epoxy-1,2-dihydrophenyl)acetyl-CoA isomerase
MTEPVQLIKDGHITKLLLNRPEVYNSIDLDLVQRLQEHLLYLAMDNTSRAVVISGNGKAFCAGGDLKWMLNFPRGSSAALHELAARLHQSVLEIRRMRKPVIAAINGIAVGAGFSLALACDFRIMARSAFLQQAYTSAGLCLDGGGSFTLPRIVGLARALEIVAFDQRIPAEQALAWGLVTQVVDDGLALEEAAKMARQLAQGSMNSLGWSKKLLTDSFNTSFETHLEREREGVRSCAAHPDGQEGIRAFVEKRKPMFNRE